MAHPASIDLSTFSIVSIHTLRMATASSRNIGRYVQTLLKLKEESITILLSIKLLKPPFNF